MKKFDRAMIPECPDLYFESGFWKDGIQYVGGVDEAGRGALAGPVAAAVVILPADLSLTRTLSGLKDSKLVKPDDREKWRERLQALAVDWGVGFADNLEIDQIGIVPATRLAVQRAIEGLRTVPQHLLVDYLDLPGIAIPQTSLVKGDARSLSIAAASIFAKTARDAKMIQADQDFPGYGFARHKGYGTKSHRTALQNHGFCALHRKSFHFHKLSG